MKKVIIGTFLILTTLLFSFNIALALDAPAWVNDGTGDDIDYTNNASSYSANWAAVDFSEATDGQLIRYEYQIGYYVGLDFSQTDWGEIKKTYPDIPDTYITKYYSLSEGEYIIRVRAGKYDSKNSWWVNSPSWKDSDGFIVDTTDPTASIDTLSSQQSSQTFTVSWSGEDPTSGGVSSGIASYDIQYRDGQTGSWINWKNNTTQTQAIFSGQWRHTYYFRARATDNAGNTSGWSSAVATSTDTVPPTSSIQSLSSIQNSTSFALHWSGTDNESGISYYDVQVKTGNGQWQSFLSHTSATSSTFIGTNGQSYQFRVRAVDVAGNVGNYSAAAQTVIQATGVSLSVSASPTSLSFSTGEEDKSVTLRVTASGPGSVTITRILEERRNTEIGTETLPPETVNQTVSSGTSVNLTKNIHLSATQRATILTTSTKHFNLNLTVEGNDSYGNPVSSSISIPVQVTELPPPSLVINDVTITLPQSPYYIGDIIENPQVTIDANGSGLVEGQILIDGSTDWSNNPQFSVNVNGRTTFNINGNIPTTSSGNHTIEVQITNPIQFSKQESYTVSDQTPPFPPQTLVLVKDVAVLKNLNGTAQATTVTGANGYVEYDFTGTADMTLISLKNTEIKEVTVTNLIVRYDNSDPTKAKIRGGTVEKEKEDGYFTDFAKGTLRITKVSFTGQVSPATDFIRVDAKLYWKKIDKELFKIGGFIVRTEGVEAKSVNVQESQPLKFDAFGLNFKLHNVDSEPALVFGKDEANDRYYFSLSGSIAMKEKKGTTTKDNTITTFKGFSIYSDGDVTGTITITKKIDLIPDMVTLTEIMFQHENDNLVCKIKGSIHDLPSPLNDLQATEFSIKFDKDGNVEGNITVLKELEKGNKGHGIGNNDSTEWDVGIGTIDITYLNLYIQFDEGTLNKDHSELQLGMDLYLNLKNQDGGNPTPDEKRVSFGEINQNDDFTGGIRVNFDGDFTWNSPTNATIISNKKLDLAVITIMIDALGIQTGPFAIVFTGSILFDVESIQGGISFENLVVGLDGVVSNLSDSITGGNLSVMDMVQVEVGDINWSMDETDLTFKENQTQGEGENRSPKTGDKTIRVENYFQLLEASMSIGDGDGNTIMSGGFQEFTIYKPVNGSRSFVLKEANLSVSDITLHADVEYSLNLLLFAGSLEMPGPEGEISAIACGKFGVQNNKPTMGIFIAAAGLSITVGPGVFLDEVGGGFFLNPIPDDIAMVRKMSNFERPELNDSIQEMRPGGADNPGSFALMLLGGIYVSSPDVMSGRALATLTSNYFNLDAEIELTEGLLKGTAYFAIGWNPVYAEGAVDIQMNYVDIIAGQGNLDFYAYGSDAWGVMGDLNVALLGMNLASGSVFVGNPGFMLETSVTAGLDLKIVSGSYTISGMFWYYRTPDPDTFGAYGKVSAEGEFLEGLLGAKASLEGALMAVPSFVFYSVGSVDFKVCYVTVFKGSLWIAVSSHGFDGGKGRNDQYDSYIEEARNMANDLKSAKDDLEGDLEQAKAELVKLNDEQREAAGLALVERSGVSGELIQTAFNQQEIMNWENALPPELAVIDNKLFGSEQQQLVNTRNQLSSLDQDIQNNISELNNLQPAVVDGLKNYEDLIVGELPSVRDIGTMKDPFKGMQTKVVKDKNGHNITITTGFQLDEHEAQSQRDKLSNLRDDFAEYQDDFIKQAGAIDGSLQRLDEILFMNDGNLNQLVEKYTTTYHNMSDYIDKYVKYQGVNADFAQQSIDEINSSMTPQQIESVMEAKARQLINQGQQDKLNDWNQNRINLIQVLVQSGGVEGYNPPEELTTESDPVELFKITGREIWWEIPMKGFQVSSRISSQRRINAINTFEQNANTFDQKWSAASVAIDTVYQRKADLYNLLYEIYDELATYGTGMIGILDDGNACGFEGIAGAGLGFRTRDVARAVSGQGYTPPGDVIYPQAPTMGPLRPPVKIETGSPQTKIQAGTNIGAISKGSNYDLKWSIQKQSYLTDINDISDLYAQAGMTDVMIAQVSKKVKTGTSGKKAAGATTANIGTNIGGKILPAYKSVINRKIIEFLPKNPVKWVPINVYFAAKRGEIEPYIEIPEITSFNGTIVSATQFDALLNATVHASHPIGVVEYSFKIMPAEENELQSSLMLEQNKGSGVVKSSPLNLSNVPWYLRDGELYAGGVPDAATEKPNVPQQIQQIQQSNQGEGVAQGVGIGVKVFVFRPWFSMGGINIIKEPFFSDVHRAGEYYLYVRVRGAGGYSIERRARLSLQYFNPDSDNTPIVSSIDTSDTTPPTRPVVTLSSPYTSNRYMLYANWEAHDPESGIQRYEYGISLVREIEQANQVEQTTMSNVGVSPAIQAIQGTTGQGQADQFVPDVLSWTNAGGRTEANIRRINLEDKKKYKVWVRATNGVGLKSIGSSEEVLVDTTPPTKPAIYTFERVDMGYYPNSVHFIFEPGEDYESGIVHNYFALGTEKGTDNLYSWTEVNSFDIKVANLPINQGQDVWLSVESYNGAGLKSVEYSSIVVQYNDSTPAEQPSVVTLPVGATSSTDNLSIGWNILYDADSGIVKYEYGLGTNEQTPDVISWQSVENVDKPVLLATSEQASEFESEHAPVSKSRSIGKNAIKEIRVDNSSSTVVTHIVAGNLSTDFIQKLTDLHLSGGTTYYGFVRVTNGAGLTSIGVSEPLIVDTSKPDVTIEGPETVNLSFNWSLPVTIRTEDNESGVYKYRYAVWQVEEQAKIDEIDENLYAYAGISDFNNGFLIASSKKAPETTSPSTKANKSLRVQEGQSGGENNSYQNIINQGSPQLKGKEGQPWLIEETVSPWAQSSWQMITSGVPPKETELQINITKLPHPGLEIGKSYRVKVWVMNGAGLIGKSNSIIIHTTGVTQPEVNVPSNAAQGNANNPNIPKY